MDLLILIIVIFLVAIFFRKFSNFVYAFAIVDIFLRILNFIRMNIGLDDVSNLIEKYFRSSIPAMIDVYTSGSLNMILMWIYVIIFMIFEFYIIRTFFHKKK